LSSISEAGWGYRSLVPGDPFSQFAMSTVTTDGALAKARIFANEWRKDRIMRNFTEKERVKSLWKAELLFRIRILPIKSISFVEGRSVKNEKPVRHGRGN
jgi:hypothetical protein